jgi:GT2 family glycosyltransferase
LGCRRWDPGRRTCNPQFPRCRAIRRLDHDRTTQGVTVLNTQKKRCLVTIPAFGSDSLTHAVIPDVLAESDLVDLVIVDNGGHYQRLADEWVIEPGENIGWAGASNLGFRIAARRGYEFGLTLNNDTRLSRDFFAGLLDPRLPSDAGVIGPTYDSWWAVQSTDFKGEPHDYPPQDFFRDVPYIDGTAFMLSTEAHQAVGGLDERSFGKFAWGADIDLCLRVKRAGFGVYVTERSFVHHLEKASANEAFGKVRYQMQGLHEFKKAMRRLYGRKKLPALRKAEAIRLPLETAPSYQSARQDPT